MTDNNTAKQIITAVLVTPIALFFIWCSYVMSTLDQTDEPAAPVAVAAPAAEAIPEVAPALQPDTPLRFVQPDTAIVRSGPGMDHGEVATLHVGDSVTLIEERDAWSNVKTDDGAVGWVQSAELFKWQ